MRGIIFAIIALILGLSAFAENDSFPIENSLFSEPSDAIYTGSPITPAVTVVYDGATLSEGLDYKYSYINNKNAGKAYILIYGIGNFDSVFGIKFNIMPADINSTDFSSIADMQYNGSEILPDVVLTYNGIVLRNGKDFTVEYSNNISLGQAAVSITGIGNFTGTRTEHFNIKNIAVDVPSAKIGLRYNGAPQTGVDAGTVYAVSGNTAVDAGEYNADAILLVGYEWNDGTTENKTIAWTIEKADGTVTSLPVANELTYNCAEQALVTAAFGTGSVVYSLDGISWDSSIPTAENAGVYTVFCKALESDNYLESSVYSVNLTISKADGAITSEPVPNDITYNEHAQELIAAADGTGTIVYSLDGENWSESIPTAVHPGAYTVYFKALENSNYLPTAIFKTDVTIKPRRAIAQINIIKNDLNARILCLGDIARATAYEITDAKYCTLRFGIDTHTDTADEAFKSAEIKLLTAIISEYPSAKIVYAEIWAELLKDGGHYLTVHEFEKEIALEIEFDIEKYNLVIYRIIDGKIEELLNSNTCADGTYELVENSFTLWVSKLGYYGFAAIPRK